MIVGRLWDDYRILVGGLWELRDDFGVIAGGLWDDYGSHAMAVEAYAKTTSNRGGAP